MLKFLSASKIGFPCVRNLWYSVNNYKGRLIDKKTQRIFDVGTYLEPLIVKWLRQDGWDVDYNAGSQNAPLKFEIPLAGGVLNGHPDCFISKRNLPHILADIKTMNERSFITWKRNGSVKSKSQYVDQLHVYADGAINAGYKVDKLAIIGVNKNTSEMKIDFFNYDIERSKALQKRAEDVFKAVNAPVENCPAEDWCCRYCEFANLCELCNTKRNTEVGDIAQETEDIEIINAIEQLQETREMTKSLKTLEDEVKALIDEKVRSHGINSLKAGKFILNLSERTSNRFDEKAFKEAHPEIAQKFEKEVKALYYEVNEIS